MSIKCKFHCNTFPTTHSQFQKKKRQTDSRYNQTTLIVQLGKTLQKLLRVLILLNYHRNSVETINTHLPRTYLLLLQLLLLQRVQPQVRRRHCWRGRRRRSSRRCRCSPPRRPHSWVPAGPTTTTSSRLHAISPEFKRIRPKSPIQITQ